MSCPDHDDSHGSSFTGRRGRTLAGELQLLRLSLSKLAYRLEHPHGAVFSGTSEEQLVHAYQRKVK